MTTEMTTFKIMGIADMQNRYNDFAEFSKSILKEQLDYGESLEYLNLHFLSPEQRSSE